MILKVDNIINDSELLTKSVYEHFSIILTKVEHFSLFLYFTENCSYLKVRHEKRFKYELILYSIMNSIKKSLKFKISNIKHLRCTKDMSFNQQFITKWKETFRKSIGVYEKLIDISKLFEV